MKKTLKTIFLILILFISINVKAKTYGLEYKPIETLDLKTEETKKYRFYKESKIEAYFIENENPNGFQKQSSFKYTDYSEWFKTRPESKKNREIKERTVYKYAKLKKIKHFYIEVEDPNMSTLEFAIRFNGLDASNSGYCSDCSDFYYMHISDNDYDYPVRVNELSLTYQEYYLPSELSIKVKLNKENLKYKILIYGDNLSEILYEANFISDLNLHNYTIDDFEAKNAYEDEIIKYEIDNNMHLIDSFVVQQCNLKGINTATLQHGNFEGVEPFRF